MSGRLVSLALTLTLLPNALLTSCGSGSPLAHDASTESDSASSGAGSTGLSTGGSSSSGSSDDFDSAGDSTLEPDGAALSSSSGSGSASSGSSGGPITDAASAPDSPAPDASGIAADSSIAADSGGIALDSGGDAAASLPPCTSVCAPGAPSGWTGPFQLYTGAASGEPAACPASVPNQVLTGYSGLSAPTPTCSTCGCTAGQPYCEVQFIATTGSSCNLFSCYETTQARSGTCVTTLCSGGELWYETHEGNYAPTPVAGWSTTATPQTGVPEPYSWSSVALGCAPPPPNGACDAGQVCVPQPAAPFETAMCVLKSGTATCPGAVFTTQYTFYTGVDDSRECVPCGCLLGSGVTCTGTLSLYSDSACEDDAGVGSTTNFSGGCYEVSAAAQSWKMTDASFSGTPSGVPFGGTVGGSASPTGPITVCCTH